MHIQVETKLTWYENVLFLNFWSNDSSLAYVHTYVRMPVSCHCFSTYHNELTATCYYYIYVYIYICRLAVKVPFFSMCLAVIAPLYLRCQNRGTLTFQNKIKLFANIENFNLMHVSFRMHSYNLRLDRQEWSKIILKNPIKYLIITWSC